MSDLLWGYQAAIWEVEPVLHDERLGTVGEIPYFECPGCEKFRARLQGDYLCLHCRYPLMRRNHGKFLGWTGPGCRKHRAALDSIPHDLIAMLERL